MTLLTALRVVKDTYSVFKRTLIFVKPIRATYVLMALLGSANGLAYTFVIARTFQLLLGSLSTGNRQHMLEKAALSGGVVFGSAILLGFVSSKLSGYVKCQVAAFVRQRLHDHVLAMSKRGLDATTQGEFLASMGADVDATRDFIGGSLVNGFLSPLVEALGSIFLLSFISPWLTVGALVGGVLCFVAQTRFLPKADRLARGQQEAKTGALSIALNVIQGFPVVRLFAIDNELSDRFGRAIAHMQNIGRKQAGVAAVQTAIGRCFAWLNDAAMVGIGLFLIGVGSITVGALFAAMRYAAVVTSVFDTLALGLGSLQRTAAGARRLFRILDLPEETGMRVQASLECPVPAAGAPLTAQDLSFSYGDGAMTIEHIDLVVSAGEVVGIVGPSGAGKSTLLLVALGLYPACTGNLWVFDQLMTPQSAPELRARISYVPQVVHLFDGTIRENVLLGKQDACEAELEEATMLAGIRAFIVGLPESYDTQVGEHGALLSSGERQRIGIARALIRRPKLLLLDEPTSALDAHSENLVMESIANLRPQPAVLMVVHRLSTLLYADRVLFMQNGRIVERGSHSELIERESSYALFYRYHTGEVKVNPKE